MVPWGKYVVQKLINLTFDEGHDKITAAITCKLCTGNLLYFE